MSDSQLSKAEVLAMLEVQKDAATQMQKVASSLQEITKTQEQLITTVTELEKSFRNGVCDRIVERISSRIAAAAQPFEDKQKQILKSSERALDNTTWLKIIVGGATLIIIIVTVIVRTIGGGPSSEELAKVISRELRAERELFLEKAGIR